PHALRGATRFANFVRVDADYLAVFRDDHDVRLFRDLQRGNNRAVALCRLHVHHALAAARRDAVYGQGRALTVTLFGDGEHQRGERVLDVLVVKLFQVLSGLVVFLGDNHEVRLNGVHADDVVALVQVHAVHAAGVAAHGAHLRFAEQNG